MPKRVILIKGSGFKSGKDTAALFIANALQRNRSRSMYKGMFAFTVKQLTTKLTSEQMVSDFDEDNPSPFKNGSLDFTQEQKEKFLPEWGMTLGRMLQLLATEGMRNGFSEDIHMKAEARRMNRVIEMYDKDTEDITIIISDWRFQNETEIVRYLKGDWILHTINVFRDANIAQAGQGKRDMGHASETAELVHGHDINNNGSILELAELCREFVHAIIE